MTGNIDDSEVHPDFKAYYPPDLAGIGAGLNFQRGCTVDMIDLHGCSTPLSGREESGRAVMRRRTRTMPSRWVLSSVAVAVLLCAQSSIENGLWAQQQAQRSVSKSGASCTIVPGADLVQLAPGSSLAQALRGRVAGLNVSTANGMAGTGSTFNSRGNSSFVGPVPPIVFVDGTRMTPMSSTGGGDHPATQILDLIDPSEVERVEVLRGPAATALYGTNGSGGVIHVFTKKGDHKAASLTDPKSSCP